MGYGLWVDSFPHQYANREGLHDSDTTNLTSAHISRRNHPKLKTQNPKLKTVKEAYLVG